MALRSRLVAVHSELSFHDAQGSLEDVALRLVLAQPTVDTAQVHQSGGHHMMICTWAVFNALE